MNPFLSLVGMSEPMAKSHRQEIIAKVKTVHGATLPFFMGFLTDLKVAVYRVVFSSWHKCLPLVLEAKLFTLHFIASWLHFALF